MGKGVIHNLPYHQTRMQRSRRELFQTSTMIDLQSHITPPDKTDLYRCRILYREQIESIEYLPYKPRTIKRLKIVPSDIQYTYKYADRSELNALLENHSEADEVLIEKDGLLTDTTIANIALLQNGQWYTPLHPLLEGTMRAQLIDKGILQLREIATREIEDYTHLALMNAMIGFNIYKIYSLDLGLNTLKIGY